VTVIKLEPIGAKIRDKIPLTTLLPRGELEWMREKLRSDAQSDDSPMSDRAAEFVAHYMLAFHAAWALLTIPAFEPLARRHEQLEDEFMSGGPPVSPIYDSYSSVHALAEIPVGIGSETPMSVLARLTVGSSEHRSVHLLASEIASSHLDLYRAKEAEGSTAQLVHVRSGRETVVHLTGPFLRDGELFLGRMIRFHTGDNFIADSPYLLMTSEAAWLEYFDRVARPELNAKHKARQEHSRKAGDREARLVRHLRQGESYRFWPEFITNAYTGHRNGIVGLTGIPDRPETQPHHEAFDETTFESDHKALEETLPPLERLRRKLYADAEARGIVQRYTEFIRSVAADAFTSPTTAPYQYLFRAFCCFGAPTEKETTLLEEHAASGLASPDEMSVIRALGRGWFSLFEIRRVNLDRSLEVIDLLRRKRLEISERSATRSAGVTDVLAGWIMIDDDGTCRLEGGILHLRSLLATQVLEEVKDARRAMRGIGTGPSRLAWLVPDVILATQRWTAHFSGLSGGKSSPNRSKALPNPLPTEVQTALSAELTQRLRQSLDESIPMFQNKTLRQLARNPKTRPDAITWLREQERILRASPPPSIRVDLRPLWAELGLDYQGLDTDPES